MDKFFHISERGSNVRTEIMAGLTTFFAMAYIVLVNPNQVAADGKAGWLVAEGASAAEVGRVWNAVFIASVLVAVIGTLLMAFLARMPYAQACGMGLNSFFCTSFVSGAFFAGCSVIEGYQSGLVIILLSGIVFLILSVTGLRKYIATAMPECLKKSIPAGIGLFIALVGLKGSGLVQANKYTLVQIFDFHGAISGAETPAAAWKAVIPPVVTIIGIILIAVLAKLNVKGNIVIGIIVSTVLYYVFNLETPSFDVSSIGQSFKDFGEIGFLGCFKADAWRNAFESPYVGGVFSGIMLIVAFCLVDMFDTIGTLIGVSDKAGMLDEDGKLPNVKQALMADAIATSAGAVLGTSTTTTFVESSAGVGAGARTGLASIVTGLLFLLAIFFAPIFTAIPGFATAPALIFVGFLMVSAIVKVDFEDLTDAVPAYLCLIAMPLMYSIAEGIAIGVISFVLINLICGKRKKITPLMYILAVLFICKYIFL